MDNSDDANYNVLIVVCIVIIISTAHLHYEVCHLFTSHETTIL